jgi:glutamate 5-kinase
VSGAEIPEELWQAAGGSSTVVGTGGMLTKLRAAELARRSGVTVVIAGGGQSAVITRLARGELLGTRFHPTASALDSRKRYILAGSAAGVLTVDDGAGHALRNGGSLLSVGVVAIEGAWERGDPLLVVDQGRRQLARGLANYASDDVQRLLGAHSDQIEARLGYHYGDEVIHRDNLVVLE